MRNLSCKLSSQAIAVVSIGSQIQDIVEEEVRDGLCEEMAREKGVEAQTPQDAQKDTLAATKVVHERWLVDTCRIQDAGGQWPVTG